MSTVQDAPPIIPSVAPEAADPQLFLFDAEAFEKMTDAGIFADGDRVELWDGRITIQMAKTQAHAASSINVPMALSRILPPGWCLSGDNPIALSPQSTPLPDFAVLRGRGNDYRQRRPTAGDVGLVVELSFTSLKSDPGPRLQAYAAVNVPVYWVLNLIENTILSFERPISAEQRYEASQIYLIGQSIPFRLDGVLIAAIPAGDLLPS